MFAATEAAVSAATFNGIPVHPGEDASAKEEADWWRLFDGIVAVTDSAHYIAGSLPPRVAHLQDADLTDFVELHTRTGTADFIFLSNPRRPPS